jgi:hypothetical protein
MYFIAFLFIYFIVTEDGIHTKQVPYHWARSSALFILFNCFGKFLLALSILKYFKYHIFVDHLQLLWVILFFIFWFCFSWNSIINYVYLFNILNGLALFLLIIFIILGFYLFFYWFLPLSSIPSWYVLKCPSETFVECSVPN